jgi:hypothetical protein
MKRLIPLLAAVALATTSFSGEPPRLLDKANVLPLALDDAFQFRKTKTFLTDPLLQKPTIDPMIAFERQRVNFGAVTNLDRQARYGHYFTFSWRTKRTADLTLRLEYRQANLGAHVQAQELYYQGAKGSFSSDFKVVGDDYREDGRITAWRALLIENGKIVGLHQSFLWN